MSPRRRNTPKKAAWNRCRTADTGTKAWRRTNLPAHVPKPATGWKTWSSLRPIKPKGLPHKAVRKTRIESQSQCRGRALSRKAATATDATVSWQHGNIVLSQPPSNSQPSNTTLAKHHAISSKTQARTSVEPQSGTLPPHPAQCTTRRGTAMTMYSVCTRAMAFAHKQTSFYRPPHHSPRLPDASTRVQSERLSDGHQPRCLVVFSDFMRRLC